MRALNVLSLVGVALALAGCVDRALELDPADLAAPVDLAMPIDLATPPDFALTSTLVALLEVPKQGGPVVTHPKTVTIGWTVNEAEATLVDDAYKAIFSDSDYWNGVMQYGIGGGTSGGLVILDETPPASLSEFDIGPYLDARIMSGKLPMPDPQTLYVFTPTTDLVYSEGGDDQCTNWAGYHYSAVLPSNGLEVAFIVDVGCGGDDELVYVASHELVEASTDPFFKSNPAYQDPDLSEVNDICEDAQNFLRNLAPTLKVGGVGRPISLYYRNDRAHMGYPPCGPTTGPDVGDAISLTAEPIAVEPGTPIVPDATTAAKINVSIATSTTSTIAVKVSPGNSQFPTCLQDLRHTTNDAWRDRVSTSVQGPNATFSFLAQWGYRSVVRVDLRQSAKTHSYFIELIGPADPSL